MGGVLALPPKLGCVWMGFLMVVSAHSQLAELPFQGDILKKKEISSKLLQLIENNVLLSIGDKHPGRQKWEAVLEQMGVIRL